MSVSPIVRPGFLGPRDRVVVATIAHAAAKRIADPSRAASEGGTFTAGRQGTGYDKLDLLESPTAERLVKKCLRELGDPLLYDAWLLRYPVGSEIPVHTDPPVPGMCHVRINALALGSSGGVLYVDGAELPLETGDAYLFRPDVMRHMVTKVERNERLVLSVGANVDEDHARRLFSRTA